MCMYVCGVGKRQRNREKGVWQQEQVNHYWSWVMAIGRFSVCLKFFIIKSKTQWMGCSGCCVVKRLMGTRVEAGRAVEKLWSRWVVMVAWTRGVAVIDWVRRFCVSDGKDDFQTPDTLLKAKGSCPCFSASHLSVPWAMSPLMVLSKASVVLPLFQRCFRSICLLGTCLLGKLPWRQSLYLVSRGSAAKFHLIHNFLRNWLFGSSFPCPWQISY